jgi:hypothetical protein
MPEILRAITIVLMHSCPKKLQSFRKPTGNSSAPAKNASMIKTVIAKTPTHPEVMGTGTLGNS